MVFKLLNRYFIFSSLIYLLLGASTTMAVSDVLPEIQIYHNIGHRGSSYSTVAGGMAIQLSRKQTGPTQWLHVLLLYSPEQIGSARGKTAGWHFHSHGQGLEIGMINLWRNVSHFRGANIALRHLEWEDTHYGSMRGTISKDVIHFGWTRGKQLMYFLGADFGTSHTPRGSITEVEFTFGGRWAF